MSQVGTSEDRFGGEFMIQDRDHLGEVGQPTNNAKRGGNRQADQGQTGNRQQGNADQSTGSQPSTRRRQTH